LTLQRRYSSVWEPSSDDDRPHPNQSNRHDHRILRTRIHTSRIVRWDIPFPKTPWSVDSTQGRVMNLPSRTVQFHPTRSPPTGINKNPEDVPIDRQWHRRTPLSSNPNLLYDLFSVPFVSLRSPSPTSNSVQLHQAACRPHPAIPCRSCLKWIDLSTTPQRQLAPLLVRLLW